MFHNFRGNYVIIDVARSIFICNLCRFIAFCVNKITTFSLKFVLNFTCFLSNFC